MRSTFGEVFNQYFDIKDLNILASNNESLVDIITSEIINNLTIKFNDISEDDEATKLSQGEIRKSLILSSFLTNFPELESRLMPTLESKLKPRIESLELRLNQLSDATDKMNEGRKFLK